MKPYSLILATAFCVTLAGCHWGLYSSTAQIQVRPHITEIPSLGTGDGNVEINELADSISAEVQNVKTDIVLVPVIKKLNLGQTWAQRFKSDSNLWTDKKAISHLREVLQVGVVPQTSTIEITASSEVPQEAADIANAVADEYKAVRDEEFNKNYERGRILLREQIAKQEKVVEAARKAVDKIGISPPMTNNDDSTADIRRHIIQQQSLLDACNIHLKQLEADWKLEVSPVRILSRAVAPPE